MSKFLDLLKQIPPDKEEIPEDLERKLDVAAINLLNNKTADAPLDRPQSDDYVYEGRIDLQYKPTSGDSEPWEINEFREFDQQPWGLQDRWPVIAGDLIILETKIPDFWKLAVSFNKSQYAIITEDFKESILSLKRKLNKLREEEGEEAYLEELMNLRDDYLRDY